MQKDRGIHTTRYRVSWLALDDSTRTNESWRRRQAEGWQTSWGWSSLRLIWKRISTWWRLSSSWSERSDGWGQGGNPSHYPSWPRCANKAALSGIEIKKTRKFVLTLSELRNFSQSQAPWCHCRVKARIHLWSGEICLLRLGWNVLPEDSGDSVHPDSDGSIRCSITHHHIANASPYTALSYP